MSSESDEDNKADQDRLDLYECTLPHISYSSVVRGCSNLKTLRGKIRSDRFTYARNVVYTEHRDGKNVPALNEKALAELKQVREKLVVVSAVGAYRTGKSYLLSRLSKEAGGFANFGVGHTSEPKTKGMWLMLIDHPTLPEYKLALMDTEGVGDTKKGDIQHDATLFVLTCLLSNVMIYNGKNTIDEGALEKFSFTAEMSRYLVMQTNDNNVGNEDDDDDVQRFFPELVYVVRDFGLDLTADEGRELTPDEYFEHALGTEENADSTSQRTRVRNSIRKYFRQRKCFTLDAPAASKKILVKMDTTDDDVLEEDFIKGMSELCRYTIKQSESVGLEKGRKLNGRGFGTLLETYVNAYQQGEIPNVSSAMNNLKLQENRRATVNAEAFYEQEMEKFRAQRMPTAHVGEVIEAHDELKATVTIQARNEAMVDGLEEEEDFIRQLHEKLDSKKDFFIGENERISRAACLDKLNQLYESIDSKKVGIYNCPGGHRKYRTDIEVLLQEYEAEGGLGVMVMKDTVLSEFLEEKKGDNNSILAVDNAMTEKENQRIEQRRIAEEERRQRERLEQEAAEIAREDARRDREMREQMARLEREMEIERAERKRAERKARERRREMEETRRRDEEYRSRELYRQQQQYNSYVSSHAPRPAPTYTPPPAPPPAPKAHSRCRIM